MKAAVTVWRSGATAAGIALAVLLLAAVPPTRLAAQG